MPEVVVIGGGLSGLVCGLRLQESGIDVEVLEASDAVGGRVRTDRVDGFLLDRGFQVLLDSYPEARHWLDTQALGLRPFHPGCLIHRDGRFIRLEDPFRNPSRAFPSIVSPVGSFADKLRVARLRARVTWPSLEKVLARPEMTTREALIADGFSESMIEGFFELLLWSCPRLLSAFPILPCLMQAALPISRHSVAEAPKYCLKLLAKEDELAKPHSRATAVTGFPGSLSRVVAPFSSRNL